MKIGKFIKESLFPLSYTCDGCGIEVFEGNLCPQCLKDTTFNDQITCPVCGRKTEKRWEICIECKAKPPLYETAVSALVYEGTAIKLIHKFKNGDAYLKDYFADLIVAKLYDAMQFDYIAFVPMTKKAERKRGYNQSKLLAESISERIKVPVCDVVEKVKTTTEQKSLSGKDRAKNLEGSFKPKSKNALLNKSILLIDDILTTGATADAMCKSLFRAGATKVYLATIASVEYKPDEKDKNEARN